MTLDAVAIVGNVNIDIRTSPFSPSDSLFLDGETSVSEVYETVGGGAANVAAAARRLGGDVWLGGVVGDDPAGRRLEDAFHRMGISTRLSRSAAATGRSINLNWSTHHRHFVSSLPSAACLTAADIDVDSLKVAGCRHLYRADVWFAPLMLEHGNSDLLLRAREAGMTTHIDINWDPCANTTDDSPLRRRESLRRTLTHVTCAHGNTPELCRFAGTDEIDAALNSLFEAGVEMVILHLGGRGSAAATRRGDWVESPAFSVERPVCETGTGDVFSAALLLNWELPLRERLSIANKCAAEYMAGRIKIANRI